MIKRDVKKIALERIERLMEFAEKYAAGEPELARKAVLQAMRIAQKARIKIPKRYKWSFCRKCGASFYTPGSFTIRVRDRRSTHIVIRCNRCGYIKRIPVKK